MTADERLRQNAHPRQQLLDLLAAATPAEPCPRPWMVVRQFPDGSEQPVCSYRSERAAERNAVRLDAEADQLGGRYTVRRAEA